MLSSSLRLRAAAPRALLLRRAASTSGAAPLVLLEQDARRKVAVLTLNHPAKLNMLTVPMAEDFAKAIDALDYSSTNVLVVTGAGKAFSAGGDLDFLRKRAADTGMANSIKMRAFYQGFIGKLRTVPVPVIAAINGPAIGAGLAFALGADLRLAAKSARLGVTFVGLGLHPGMGSTFTLPKLVGPQVAARMLLTGETVTGTEAAAMGMVLEATEDGATLGRALELADRMAGQAPVAVRACTRSLRMQFDEGFDRALWREADAQSYSYSTADIREGISAVEAKRKPTFTQSENFKD